MAWFSKKDWNVVAIIFERKDLFQVNGNRAKGGHAEKVRDGARNHDRTIFWAVFDQKGGFLEGEPGRGGRHVDSGTLKKLTAELQRIPRIREILSQLESGKTGMVAGPLEWDGYPAAG